MASRQTLMSFQHFLSMHPTGPLGPNCWASNLSLCLLHIWIPFQVGYWERGEGKVEGRSPRRIKIMSFWDILMEVTQAFRKCLFANLLVRAEISQNCEVSQHNQRYKPDQVIADTEAQRRLCQRINKSKLPTGEQTAGPVMGPCVSWGAPDI